MDVEAGREAADGISAFAADLYTRLANKDGNLIVSPYSIDTALAMAAAGAQGSTRDELDKVLHLPAGDKLGPAYRSLTASVSRPAPSAKSKTELAVANALWLQKGRPLKRDYAALVREDFRAGLFETDFTDPGAACRRINGWAEKETRDRIKDLVPATALNRNTRIVLTNAVYFKAKWAAAFKPENTKPDDFTLTSGKTIRAPLMHQKGEYSLRDEADFQVLRLPHDGEATALYVLLPRKTNGLMALEEKLTAGTLRDWTQGPPKAPVGEVQVWLPKFKFTVPVELTPFLHAMGLNEAFATGANFGGITDRSDGVYINRVIHKAFVEVDEVGTEAAAATATATLGGAAPGLAPPPVKEFRADHPFLFVITHEPTGTVLFIGRVLDPTH